MQCGGRGYGVKAFHIAKAFDQRIVNLGVFWILVCHYHGFQCFHIGIKTLAIRVRNFFGFATLIMHLIHVVSELLVLEGHLCIIRRRIHVVYHVRHGCHRGFI
jgi:hypothetical protein